MLEASFKKAMEVAGLSSREKIILDGKLHRFTIQGDKPGSKNGWYILYGDALPAGAFGSWKTGERFTWCSKAENTLTQAERLEFSESIKKAQKEREVQEAQRRTAARNKALTIWTHSADAPNDHPYLVKKSVKSHGLKLYKDALVIPMRDSEGNTHSLQFIDAEGSKRFLSGGKKKGLYFAIGGPVSSLCVAEGYATAASIYESTGLPVAVAFDAGNLLPVSKALRAKFPSMEMTICADNDEHTEGNPGLTKATEAAKACGGLLAVPPCPGDFNDLFKGCVR